MHASAKFKGHAQIVPPTMAKAGIIGWENVQGEIQPFERYSEAFVIRRSPRLCAYGQ